jgi:serine/threonine-protein kinase ATR
LNAVQSHNQLTPEYLSAAIPFAAEAAWMTNNFDALPELMKNEGARNSQHFNAGIARAFIALRGRDSTTFNHEVASMRSNVSRSFSSSNTWSLSSAHSQLLNLHVLSELEMLSNLNSETTTIDKVLGTLNRRLDIIGSFTEDKQYVLGIRRAIFNISGHDFVTPQQIASFWLQSARISRKGNQINAAHDATIRAATLENPAAKIEHAKLLWKGGFARKAIENLQAAITDGSFSKQNFTLSSNVLTKNTNTDAKKLPQNVLIAKGYLLLAKWTDLAGQEKSMAVLERYKEVSQLHHAWDKGHYFLGAFYNKILDSEKGAPDQQQSGNYLTGECTKLVIDNYLRSMVFGPKYINRTVPKVLTLWLDFAQEIAEMTLKIQAQGTKNVLHNQYYKAKVKTMDKINEQIEKYFLARHPAWVPYTAFAQILSRINVPYAKSRKKLQELIEKIAFEYPTQALWSLYAVSHSTVEAKRKIARDVLKNVMNKKNSEIRDIVQSADLLTRSLLQVCQQPFDGKGLMSLTKDLQFKRPLDSRYSLVVPLQKTLMSTLPSTSGSAAMTKHNPFPKRYITVSGFLDEVLVLSSLQRPRKLIVKGSDGLNYPILCKPKDDLRKDQRLMEFNAVIDQALKRGVDASKRKLYIKTYAVTTLNDEHGVLEWVEGLRPLRDIIINHLNRSNIKLDFALIRTLLDNACRDPVEGHKIFIGKLLAMYPPMLFKWFIETFPEPDTWFNARLRYTRSCGVMSIVGHALGLGDRHGENISLEQGDGGVFHVDFNCLFDKGLTFDKPERVPFRLTQNMVHALGAYGCDGPFRMAAEITQRTLKQHEETLMTIMEAFLYDPTTDFGLEKRRRVAGVPDTPAEVLTSVRSKFNCFLKDETVPLSVEGYVDALIRAATDPKNLVQMYVGWCPFL